MKNVLLTLGLLGFGIFPNSVSARDYLSAEIDANVVNPCMLVHIRKDATFSKLKEEDALALLRGFNPEDFQTMRDAIRPLVESKKALADREAVYTRAREFCGATQSMEPRSVPVESDAVLGSTIKSSENRQAILDELVGYVRARGWKCDSISAARKHVFSRGFDLSCNGFAYQYAVEDKGGTWVARLD